MSILSKVIEGYEIEAAGTVEGDLRFEAWVGFDASEYRNEILDQKLHEEIGLFRYCLQENDVPRVMSIVRVNEEIASYAMLIDESEVMGTALHGGDPCLGFLGVYIRPGYEGRGLEVKALARMVNELNFLKDRAIMLGETVGLCVLATEEVMEYMAELNSPVEVHEFSVFG